MKKLLFALLVTTCAMNAFIFSRPMFFIMGAITGASSVPYFTKVQKLDQEFKTNQDRINFGNKQLKNFAEYCKDEAGNSIQELISKIVTRKSNEEKNIPSKETTEEQETSKD